VSYPTFTTDGTSVRRLNRMQIKEEPVPCRFVLRWDEG
jgi:hypothetical protein